MASSTAAARNISPRGVPAILSEDDDLNDKMKALRALHAAAKNESNWDEAGPPPPVLVLKAGGGWAARQAAAGASPRQESDPPIAAPPKKKRAPLPAVSPRQTEKAERERLAKALEATWLESPRSMKNRLLKEVIEEKRPQAVALPQAPSLPPPPRREKSAKAVAAAATAEMDEAMTEEEKELARLAVEATNLRLKLAAKERAKRAKEVEEVYKKMEEKKGERERQANEAKAEEEAERKAAQKERREAAATRRAVEGAARARREAAAARARQAAQEADAAKAQAAKAEEAEKQRQAAETAEAARLAAEARLHKAAKARAAQRRAEETRQVHEAEERRRSMAELSAARAGRRMSAEREREERGEATFEEAARRAARRHDFATLDLVKGHRAPEEREAELATFLRRERLKKEERARQSPAQVPLLLPALAQHVEQRGLAEQRATSKGGGGGAWADDRALKEHMSSALQPSTHLNQQRMVSSAPIGQKQPQKLPPSATADPASMPLAVRLAARRAEGSRPSSYAPDAPKGPPGGWSDWS